MLGFACLLFCLCSVVCFVCSSVRIYAGSLTWGDAGTNHCPYTARRITDGDQCYRAAATAGKSWGSITNRSDYPRGCFLYRAGAGAVHFNIDAIGRANVVSQLLCEVGTGALARTRLSVCVRACVRACVCVCV
jgi:hypothetical protein